MGNGVWLAVDLESTGAVMSTQQLWLWLSAQVCTNQVSYHSAQKLPPLPKELLTTDSFYGRDSV